MSLANLDNLVKTGKLKIESFQEKEFRGLLLSGKVRLKDANNATLASESRFDLAYNAAHSLALAALRWHGYRSEDTAQGKIKFPPSRPSPLPLSRIAGEGIFA